MDEDFGAGEFGFEDTAGEEEIVLGGHWGKGTLWEVAKWKRGGGDGKLGIGH